MKLKDVLDNVNANTGIRLFDKNGKFIEYDFADMLIDYIYDDCEVVLPISVKDDKLEIWIDTKVILDFNEVTGWFIR